MFDYFCTSQNIFFSPHFNDDDDEDDNEDDDGDVDSKCYRKEL